MNVTKVETMKKTEHVLTLTVEFDEPVTTEEAIRRVLYKLDGNCCDGVMEAAEETIKEEPKQEKRKSPVKIDWDKACALKLAGWKNADIATELHANEGTIANGIYKHLVEYEAGKREGRCEETEENEL